MNRPLVVMAAFAVLAAACGQYPGVHEQTFGEDNTQEALNQPGVGQELPDGGGTTGGTTGGTVGGGTTGGGTTGGTVGGGTTAGGTTGGGTTGGGTTGGTGGGGTKGPAGGDTTGVTATTIKIGLHAPLSGAAPISPESFREGKDLYWQHGNKGKPVTIFGRRVQVFFENDRYNPSTAKQVCQKMAEQDEVFLLIGGGGTDQIQACAQYAASRGIPYLSAGVTEINLRGLSNYFSLSMSYPQQGPLVAQYIKKNFTSNAKDVAMVATRTVNFNDAVDSFVRAFPGVRVFRPDKNDRASSMAQNLCTGTSKKFKVVYPLTSPNYYLEMAKFAKCNPQYVGVGITNGLDTVAHVGCEADGSTRNARFFSPAPAYENTDRFDPQFRKAGGTDDIMWLIWGLNKTLHQLFVKAGKNLTREGFMASTSRATVKTGVYPELRYTPSDHFGAHQVHVLKNVCQRRGSAAGYYITESAFRSSF